MASSISIAVVLPIFKASREYKIKGITMTPSWFNGINAIPAICIHGLHLHCEGDAIGAINVGKLTGISIDAIGCVDAIDIEGMGADIRVETDG